jgi:hypothetical protein
MSSPLKQNTTTIQELLDTINNLPEAGTDLPKLANPANTDELFSGKQLIDGDGEIVTGTFTIDNELDAQDELIAQIQAAVEGLPEAGSAEPKLQDKTVTPSTSSQSVTADSGYDGLDTVTVNAIPNTYVKPTSTKSATTYTPSTANQTIAAGTYCSGTQTIIGDANLIPENIISGKSIFGIAGTAESESGGGAIKTATVTLANSIYPTYPVCYMSPSGAQQTTHRASPFTCVVPSIMYLNDGNANSNLSGSITKLYKSTSTLILNITGDGTITLASSGGGND